MLREGNDYTTRLLDLTKTVKVLNECLGLFQCDGYLQRVGEDNHPYCECKDFRGDGECIHLDAVAYVLDTQDIPA